MNSIEGLKRTIADKYGFEVSDNRQNFLQSVIAQRSRENSFENSDRYVDWVQSDTSSAEWSCMIDLLTIKETYFFRNPQQFRNMRESILPELSTKRFTWSSRPSLRILSAACATGEEAYSIAMTVMKSIPNYRAWDIRIDAFDISSQALTKARNGVYPRTQRLVESVDAVDPAYHDAYFETYDDGCMVTVRPEARSLINFFQANLKDQMNKPSIMVPTYDIVFCRNVMIYFNPEDQATLVRWINASVAPGGYLMLGDAETLHLFEHDLSMIDAGGALVYQKPE